MQFVNRSIAIIKPKQPFVDWVNATDPNSDFKVTLEMVRSDPASILIPEFDSPKDGQNYIKKIYDDIWHWALYAYWTDEKAYPKHRPFEKFKEWFDVELCSEVIDFVDGKIKKEEL
jgi:hypothetical protein